VLGSHGSSGVPRSGEHVIVGSPGQTRVFRVDDILWVTPTDGEAIKDVYVILASSPTSGILEPTTT